MTRNIKALGLMMAAVFAVSAVTAQAAFGAEEFHSHAKHIIITGETHPQFPKQITTLWVGTSEKGTVTCEEFKVEGDQEGTETPGTPPTFTSPTATVHPTYGKCTSTFGSASVNTHECHYKFAAATTSEMGSVEVICPTGQSIEINIQSGACIIKIGNQNIASAVKYTNVNTTTETNKKEITAHATTGKTISYTASGIGCAIAGIPSSGTEAEYNGTSTIKAFKYIEGITGNYKEGEQVGIWKE